MNATTSIAKAFVILLAFIFVIGITDVCAKVYYETNPLRWSPDVYDLWNISPEDTAIAKVKLYLAENDLVGESVSPDDLDYAVVMALQLQQFYPDISPGLVLAQIAVESRFDKGALSSGGARGLMQLIPSYHEDRLAQFLDEDIRYSRDLFYEPRYNIMSGLDYMNDLYHNTCDGDMVYTLMCYNQGPSSACKTYRKNGKTSRYAKQILELSEELNKLLES